MEKYNEEINKFNWGACLLGWIWGIFNKSYKTLWQLPISFIPHGGAIVSFFLSIYFGINGNKWALENKKFESIEKFQKYQRIFAVIGFLVSVVGVVLFFLNIIYSKRVMLVPVNYDFNLIILKVKLAKYFLCGFIAILVVALYIFSTKNFSKKNCVIAVILYSLMLTATGEYLIRMEWPKISKPSVVAEKNNEQNWGLYMRQIQRKIKSNIKELIFTEGMKVILTFDISKNGEISNIEITNSSGSNNFDIKVLKAIEKSTPFLAIPDSYNVKGIKVQFTAQKDVLGTSVIKSY